MLDISIILLNYKNPQLTINCINSILKSKAQVTYEVIVIDNHSEDESLECIKKAFPTIVVKDSQKNGGFAYGNNIGVRLAYGKYLLLLNNDTEIKENMLDILYEYAERNPQVGMIGCRALDGNGRELPIAHTYETLRRIMLQLYIKPILERLGLQRKIVSLFRHRDGMKNEFTPAEWIAGSALFIRKDLYCNVGGLDENFFMYMEDEDLGHRVNDAGYTVGIVNKIGYTHFCGGSTIESYFLTKEYIKSRLIYFKRYEPENFSNIKKALFSQIRVVNSSLTKSEIKKMKRELEIFINDDLQSKINQIVGV